MNKTITVATLSNWNPQKVSLMFPKLKVKEMDLEKLKYQYLEIQSKDGFKSFYDFLEFQQKQENLNE